MIEVQDSSAANDGATAVLGHKVVPHVFPDPAVVRAPAQPSARGPVLHERVGSFLAFDAAATTPLLPGAVVVITPITAITAAGLSGWLDQ